MAKIKEGIYHKKIPTKVEVVMCKGMVVYIELDKPGRLLCTMSTEAFLDKYSPADKQVGESQDDVSDEVHCSCGECLWIRRRVTGVADVP